MNFRDNSDHTTGDLNLSNLSIHADSYWVLDSEAWWLTMMIDNLKAGAKPLIGLNHSSNTILYSLN